MCSTQEMDNIITTVYHPRIIGLLNRFSSTVLSHIHPYVPMYQIYYVSCQICEYDFDGFCGKRTLFSSKNPFSFSKNPSHLLVHISTTLQVSYENVAIEAGSILH